MLGYMDAEALRRTLTRGPRHLLVAQSARSTGARATLGGNVQYVRAAALDCDGDTLLVTVEQVGTGPPHRAPTLLRRRPAPAERRGATIAEREHHDRHRVEPPRAPSSAPRSPAGHRVVPVLRRSFAGRGDADRRLPQARRSASPGRSCWSRPSRAASGRAGRSSGADPVGVLTEDGDRAVWIDYGLPAERALGADALSGPLAALDHAPRTLGDAAEPRASAAHRRPGRLHRLGGGAADRAPAGRAARRLRTARPGVSASSPSWWCSTTAPASAILIAAVAERRRRMTRMRCGPMRSRRLDGMQRGLAQPAEAWLARGRPHRRTPSRSPRIAREDYLAAVERSREYIRDGDIFQVVIAQRFDHEITAEPIDVYRVLRALNPSPYMYLLTLDAPDGSGYSIVGSSPEALVKVQRRPRHHASDRRIEPRGDTTEQRHRTRPTSCSPTRRRRREHLDARRPVAGNDLVEGLPARDGRGDRIHAASSGSATSCTWCPLVEGDLRAGRDEHRRAAGDLPGRDPVRCAQAARAWRSSTSWSSPRRGLYGGVVGLLRAGPATPTSRSPSARRTIVGGLARVQAGGGLVADSTRPPSTRSRSTRPPLRLRAVAIANAMRRIR